MLPNNSHAVPACISGEYNPPPSVFAIAWTESAAPHPGRRVVLCGVTDMRVGDGVHDVLSARRRCHSEPVTVSLAWESASQRGSAAL